MLYIAVHPKHNRRNEEPMRSGKSSTLTLRIAPSFKEALRVVADREHRSTANMVEVLIRDYCQRTGVPIPEPRDLPRDAAATGHSNH